MEVTTFGGEDWYPRKEIYSDNDKLNRRYYVLDTGTQ